ncbi:MAG TPA: dipeptidase [Patescibacteria group bacterium]|nr:dipeptidase [Patescibacteria group bacterium]
MNLVDLHCDTILQLMDQDSGAELRRNHFHVDLEKMRRADSLAQVFALFVNLEKTANPWERYQQMADCFYRELDKNQDEISFAGSYEEIIHNQRQGKMSALLAIEEGGVLQGSMEKLHQVYERGVRLLTLTWNYPNEIGFPNCRTECQRQGLTSFGHDAVAEMNRLGMIIDVSHLSDQGFYDVAHGSSRPFVASHSNARTVWDHTRNLNDDMLRLLAEKGGVTGLNFCAGFLGSASLSRVEDMVRHLWHIRNVGGMDVLAIGTDFDGIEPKLEINDMGEMDKLVTALQRQGFSTTETEKIFSGNALRVLRDVLR